jgi:beta-lactamase superfamily II metal-dependent hydrolase
MLAILAFTFTSGCSPSVSEGPVINVFEEMENAESINEESPSIATPAGSSEDTAERNATPEDAVAEKNPRDGPEAVVDHLEGLKVHYVDLGQADATLFEYSHEGTEYRFLIDSGNWNSSNVVNYLQSQKIKDIDIVVITHPHADHIGQLDKIIENFNVTEVWMSGDTTTSQVFQRALSAIDTHNIDYYEPRAGDVFDIGPLVVEVINPQKLTGDLHEGSVSMRIQYGEVSFLFTGDAEKQTEQAILNRGYHVKADILQLGHHGSKTSTIPEFLEEVNPEVAIYSAGKDNQYGHPHDEVLDRVKNAGIELYGTKVHGTIVVETDGKDYKISASKGGTDLKTESNNSAGCIDINTANIEELQNITHISPSRAQELIQLRLFSSIDDMKRINGIGPARIEEIKTQGLACVGG